MSVKNLFWTENSKHQQLLNGVLQGGQTIDFLNSFMSVVQEGVSLLDTDLRIICQNKSMDNWFNSANVKNGVRGKKCYQVYKGADSPCNRCPVKRTLQSGEMETELVSYTDDHGLRRWNRVYSSPVKNEKGKISMIIEYVKDVTLEVKNESEMEMMRNQNELILKASEETERQVKNHEVMYINNVVQSVYSVLAYLEKILDEGSYAAVEQQFAFVLQTGTVTKREDFSQLSEKELLIARYIRDGYMSKDIANMLNLSKKTIDFYRLNIRKKLELGEGDNLKTYLKQYLGEL